MKTTSRAILFRVGGLGDLLVALPALSLVRRGLPAVRLTLAARPEYGALFKAAGIVDEVVAFDDPVMAALFAHDEKPIAGANKVSAQKRMTKTVHLPLIPNEKPIGNPKSPRPGRTISRWAG